MQNSRLLFALLLAAGCSSSTESSSIVQDDTDDTEAPTYAVGGSVSGLVGQGEIIVMNNLGDETIVDANGDFTLTTELAAGDSYEITLDFSAHYVDCTVTNESGIVADADITDITIECGLGTYEEFAQPADVVIGADDFETVSEEHISYAWGNAAYANGILFLSDGPNNRIVMYDGVPTENGAAPAGVLGQASLSDDESASASASTYSNFADLASDGEHLLIADSGFHRVLMYNTIPSLSGGFVDADIVFGQADFTSSEAGTTALTLDSPKSVFIGAGKVLIADSGNNRVLIWNTIPTEPGAAPSPDLVLGQSDFDSGNAPGTTTASSLDLPYGMWTDGTRLVVADSLANRVLIWNTFPETNGQAADVVLGQTDYDNNDVGTSSTGLWSPMQVASNGTQLFVVDDDNNRVLIWDSFPTENTTAADRVLGQVDFNSNDGGTTQTSLVYPYGVTLVGNQVIVCDYDNSRYMVYNALAP